MMEAFSSVQVRGPSGVETVELRFATRQPYWLRLAFAGGRTIDVRPARGDLLTCLDELRRQLEADGMLLCCQGARPSVWAPDVIRQMSGGRDSIQHYKHRRSGMGDEVDIFAPADCDDVATLAHQYDEFFGTADTSTDESETSEGSSG